jgi:hypothetical protein
MADISLWLDSYDDIFSDFDSRNYIKRRVSEDFIDELKAALKYRTEHLDALVLLLPPDIRKADSEKDIVAGLKDQFRHRNEIFVAKHRKIFRKGILMSLGGLALMTISSLMTVKGYPAVALHITIDPGSWFMLWTGLDALLYDYRTAIKDSKFYALLEQLKIHFKDS